jgi:hypothetical protein
MSETFGIFDAPMCDIAGLRFLSLGGGKQADSQPLLSRR